jgi:predicted metal-dependent HD superfamily phosphohydrolase
LFFHADPLNLKIRTLEYPIIKAMSDLIQETEQFVEGFLTEHLDPKYLYHNLQHTRRVVKSTKELLDHYGLLEKEKEAVLLAAWLHDTGYTKDRGDHEEKSCEIARNFLQKKHSDAALIEQVCLLIMATKRHHQPKGLAQEIIRDADSSHIGMNGYLETSELLREELALLDIAHYTAEEWRDENIKMLLTEHRFYTDYAIENWQKNKEKNIRKFKKAIKERMKIVKKEQLKADFKNESPERGIQTMFRITMQNHLKLSDIADTKANILLSVNAIIISLVLSNLLPKLDNPSNDYLILPTAIFLLFSIASMTMSILATRPNITGGQFSREDVRQKKVNLLFFGNFHKMELPDYEWAIQELIKDKKFVYTSLTKDLYYLGLVLNRKYKLLRWTYTVFLIGMLLSVIVFFGALELYGPMRISDITN